MNGDVPPQKGLRNLQNYKRPDLQDRACFEPESVNVVIGAVHAVSV